MASRTVEPRDLWRIWKTIFPEESFPISSWTAPGLAYQPPQNLAAPLGSQACTTWPSIVRSAFPLADSQPSFDLWIHCSAYSFPSSAARRAPLAFSLEEKSYTAPDLYLPAE